MPIFLVAVEGDGPVGAVLGRYDGRRGWVNHLAVARHYREQGIGGQLMQEVEQRLQLKGCARVCLFIEPGNADIETFYQQFGYDRRELILMEKWLALPAEQVRAMSSVEGRAGECGCPDGTEGFVRAE